MGEVRPQKAEGFGRYSRLALAYGKSVGFLVVRFLGFPKSIEELFGKRSGNCAKLPPLLSAWYKAQVCRVVPKLCLRCEP